MLQAIAAVSQPPTPGQNSSQVVLPLHIIRRSFSNASPPCVLPDISLRPLLEKIRDQLDDYVDAVDAEADLGVGNGLRWPVQVLQSLVRDMGQG